MSFAVVRGEPTEGQLWLDKQLDEIVAETGREEDRYNLGQVIFRSLKRHPTFIQSIECSSGEKMLNSELLDKSVRTARALRAAGVGKGDVVMIIATRHNLTAVPYFASLFIGAVSLHIDDASTKREILNFLNISEPKCIFTDSKLLNTVDEAVDEYDGKRPFVISFEADKRKKCKDICEFIRKIEVDLDNFRLEDISRRDICILVCTSGSTGFPKAISLTSYGLLVSITPSSFLEDFTNDYKVLVTSSIQWLSYILFTILAPIYGVQKLQSRLTSTPEHIIEICRKYGPHLTVQSPSSIVGILNSPGYKHGDLFSFKTIFCGGAFASADLQIRALKEMSPGGNLIAPLGCSEMAGSLTSHTATCSRYSIGVELNTLHYKVVDDNNDEVPLGTTGELIVKGKELYNLGYYRDEETTKESFLPGGWFKTGDLVYKKENGEYYYVERKKCLIKYGNYHIYPVEVESVISELEGVTGAGVCWTERGLTALVETASGAQVTEQQVIHHVKSKLSYYKAPSCVFFAPIPNTVSGKIKRKALADLVERLITEKQ